MIAAIVICVTAVLALLILGGAAWFAFDSDKRIRKFARSTDLIPGKPSRAPAEWATGNTREALLHRRIRYAIADVHNNPAIAADGELIGVRDRLDDAVFALDDWLIAASDSSGDEKAAALDSAESVIKVLEELPTKLWEAPKEEQSESMHKVISAVQR